MDHPLDGCLRKLNRGEEQLHAIKDSVNALLATELFQPRIEIDRSGRVVIRCIQVREPDESLALLIGECAYSFRSALDHLAYQLATLHSGMPLPPKVERASAFPIFKSGTEYQRHAPAKVQGMSRAAQTSVERLQPYHRRKLPTAVALLWLDQICNVDKHRALHPTGSMLVGSRFGIESTGARFSLRAVEVFARQLTERAMLARFTGEFEGGVVLRQDAAFDVVFAKDAGAPAVRGRSVVGSLLAIRDFVDLAVLPELARFFPGDYEVADSPQ